MNTKIVYQTDQYGLYLNPIEADLSPLEEGVWLIPGGCVEVPPPAIPDGKAAHWDGECWNLIDCLLGLTAYNTATGEPLQIDRLGALPMGYTLKVPGPHQVWRDGEWQDDIPAVVGKLYAEQYQTINTACERAITAGFTSSSLGAPHTYSSQLDDQLNLTGAILRGLDMPYACRDAKRLKEFRMHTSAQLRQVGDDFTLHKLELLQKANRLKERLEQALADGDVTALEAVVWEDKQP